MNNNTTTEAIRLNKYLAECGICSRREADRLIENGQVIVNGVVASNGMKVSSEDEILLDGQKIEKKNEKVVLAYYKPKGVTCTEKDQHAEIKISDVFDYPIRVTYAGRLDKDSEGLLIMTNDGELIDGLMRARNFHEKEYIVSINKDVTDSFISSISKGLWLDEVGVMTRPCVAERIGKRTFRIILTQGVNRQIRRMCKALGCYVTHLKRVRVANIELGDLQSGQFREITGLELRALYNALHNNN